MKPLSVTVLLAQLVCRSHKHDIARARLSGNDSLDSSSNVSSSTIFSKHRDSAHKVLQLLFLPLAHTWQIAHLQSDISKLLDMHDIKQEVTLPPPLLL